MNKPVLEAKATALDLLAREAVGDGKAPNFFFVSVEGRVVTVTEDRIAAYNQWKRLVRESKWLEPCLEDRLTGTIASVEPNHDETPGFSVFDDYHRIFRR